MLYCHVCITCSALEGLQSIVFERTFFLVVVVKYYDV